MILRKKLLRIGIKELNINGNLLRDKYYNLSLSLIFYKRKIKEGIQGKIPFWASPTELEMMAEWQETGSGSELHLLYEKARYSKEGCLKEDLDRYKSVDENYH